MQLRRILIVDDSHTSRIIIRRCFEIAGYENAEFLEAIDGAAALGILENEAVDLVISDLKMPRMDGRTFIRKLSTNAGTREIPIIIVSSVGSNAATSKGLEKNVIAVIQKPVSPRKVVEALSCEKA